MADSIGLALLVVLETLTPAERVAFVLHDMFALPFDEVAPIVGRSPAAARQLASRARRRVHGSRAIPDTDLSEQRALVEAFLAASRGGQFETLVTMLDPKVGAPSRPAAAQMGAPSEAHGAEHASRWWRFWAERSGAVWASDGVPRVAFNFTVEHGKIVAIDLLADAEHLGRLDVAVLDD